MPEIGTATIKVVPDADDFVASLNEQIGKPKHSGFDLFMNLLSLLLLVCSPAIVWAVYGWAF